MIEVLSMRVLRTLAGYAQDDVACLLGYYAPGDKPLAFYRYDAALAMHDDGGWIIAPQVGPGRWVLLPGPVLDARDWGVTSGFDCTVGAQACLDAAYWLRSTGVRFPTATQFSRLATYPGLTIYGGGPNNELQRTAAGPGIYTTDAPGNAYPKDLQAVTGCKFVDLCVTGGGLPGSNLTLRDADDWRIENCWFRNSGSGAQFIGSISSGTLLLSSAGIVRGTLSSGMALYGIGVRAADGNVPAMVDGSGSPEVWSVSGAADSLPATPMFAVDTWTYTDAAGDHVQPSACVTFIGGCYDGLWTRGRASGTYDGEVDSAVGVYLGSVLPNGTDKPNGNMFASIYPFRCLCGVLVHEGSDNTFDNVDFQDCAVGAAVGLGPGGAYRNRFRQPYVEGSVTQPMAVGFMLDDQGQSTTIEGTGSLGEVSTKWINNGGSNNSWVGLF